MTVRTFRPYQLKIHSFATETRSRSFGVEAPTGSGKTMQIVGLVAHAKKYGTYKKVLVATTQQQIEEAIVCRSYDSIRCGKSRLPTPGDLIGQARASSKGTKASVQAFLTGDEFAIACTHSTLSTFDVSRLPEDLDGVLLIADEGHRIPAEGFARFESAWTERGGALAIFTATSYRADRKKVGKDETEWFIRSMAQHMEEGYAPENLKYGVMAVKKKAKVTYDQFTGAKAPSKPFVAEIVRSMVSEWKRLGCPKSIVQIPPMAGGTKALVESIIKDFKKEGCRVVDATGCESGKKETFLSFIRSESQLSWKDSQADIVVGSQRVVEGTDWPHCEAVLRVGIPGSVTMIVQLTGRAMRKKDGSCPDDRAASANVVFFVPTGTNSLLDKMSIDHSRAVLMISCFMADSQSGQKWLLEKELGRFRQKMKPEDPSSRANVLIQMAAARRSLVDGGKTVTPQALIRETQKRAPGADLDLVKRIVIESLLKSSESKSVKKFMDESPGMKPGVSRDVRAVLDVIVEEFRDITLDGSEDSMELIGRQTHLLDGKSISEWADRVSQSMPLEPDQVIQWAIEWEKATGRWPRQTDGKIPGTLEYWTSIHGALREGWRGLPGGQSLAQFLEETLDIINRGSIPSFGPKDIIQWAKEWNKRTQKWPSFNSGPIPGTRVTWKLVDVRLRVGTKGFLGGSGLSEFLQENCGARRGARGDELSVEGIKSHIVSWNKRTGEWPRINSGPVPGTKDTWMKFHSALSEGLRGLPRGGSLGVLVIQVSGERHPRNTKNAPMLTIEKIAEWATSWNLRTDGWPKADSGKIPDSGGESWDGVNWALRKGRRGLPGGSSLKEFLRGRFGATIKRRSSLSRTSSISSSDEHVQEVKRKMRDWHGRTGSWPSRKSTTIKGNNTNWHLVTKSLLRRKTSLPQVREELIAEMKEQRPS